jgi:hypothetical protein
MLSRGLLRRVRITVRNVHIKKAGSVMALPLQFEFSGVGILGNYSS